MSKKFWQLLDAVKHDFSDHADVRGVYIRVLSSGRDLVRVTVRDADGTFRVWEMVDDGVSGETWKLLSVKGHAREIPPTYSKDEPIPFTPSNLVCDDGALDSCEVRGLTEGESEG